MNGQPRTVPAILYGGLIAGFCDITYASVQGLLAGRPVVRTLQSVATGLLGRDALQGGWTTGALGLLLHFLIALSIATVYYAASRKLRILVDRAWLSGPLFGAMVYLFMNHVVVPLSAAPFRIPNTLLGLAVHMFGVGLPIALSVRHYSKTGA
jgi:hypothetical protein